MEGISEFLAQNHSNFPGTNRPELKPHPGFLLPTASASSFPVTHRLSKALNHAITDPKEQGVLVQKLFGFIETELFGDRGNLVETVNLLKKKNPPINSLCRKSLDIGTTAYKCLDCQKDNSCIICAECFDHGDHSGHRILRQHGCSGMCDCGDPDALEAIGFCKKHKGYLTDNEVKSFVFPPEVEKNIHSVIEAFGFCLTHILEEIYSSRNNFNTSKLSSFSETVLSVFLISFTKIQSYSQVLGYLIMKEMISTISPQGNKLFLFKHSCADLKSVCAAKQDTFPCSCSFLELLIRFCLVLTPKSIESIQEFFILFFNFLKFKTFLASVYIRLYSLFFDVQKPTKNTPGILKCSLLSSIELQIFTSSEFAQQSLKSPNFLHVLEVLEAISSNLSLNVDFSNDNKWQELSQIDFQVPLSRVVFFLKTLIAMNPQVTLSFLKEEALTRKFISVLGNLQEMFPFQWRSKIITESGKFSSILMKFIQTAKHQLKMVQTLIESANAIPNLHFRKELLKNLLQVVLKYYEIHQEKNKKDKFFVHLPLHALFVLLVHSICSMNPKTKEGMTSAKERGALGTNGSVFGVSLQDPESILSLFESLECSKIKETLRKMTKEAVRAHSFCQMATKRLVCYDSVMSELGLFYNENLFFMDIQIIQVALGAHQPNEHFFHKRIIKPYLKFHEKDIGYKDFIFPVISNDPAGFIKNALDIQKAKNIGVLRPLLELSLAVLSDSHSFFSAIMSAGSDLNLEFDEPLVQKIIYPTIKSFLFVCGSKSIKDLNKMLRNLWHLPKTVPGNIIECIEKVADFDKESHVFRLRNENEGLRVFSRDAFLSVSSVHGLFIESASKNPILCKSPDLFFLGSPEYFSFELKETQKNLADEALKKTGQDKESLLVFISLLQASLESEKLLEISRLLLSILLRVGLNVDFNLTSEYSEILKKLQGSPSNELKGASKLFGELLNKLKKSGFFEESKENNEIVEEQKHEKENPNDLAKQKQENLRMKFQLRLKKSESLVKKIMNTPIPTSPSESSLLLSKRANSMEKSQIPNETEHCVFCLGEVSKEKDSLFRFCYVQLSNLLDYLNKERESTRELQCSLVFSACSHLIHKECSEKFQVKKKTSHFEQESKVCPQCRMISNVFLETSTEDSSEALSSLKEPVEKECNAFKLLGDLLRRAETPWTPISLFEMESKRQKGDSFGMELEDGFIEKLFTGILLTHSWFESAHDNFIVDLHNSFVYLMGLSDLLGFSSLLKKKLPVYSDLFMSLRRILKSPQKHHHDELWVFCSTRVQKNLLALLNSSQKDQMNLSPDQLFVELFFDLQWVLGDFQEKKLVFSQFLSACLTIKMMQVVAAFSDQFFGKSEAETKEIMRQAKGLLLPFIKKVVLSVMIPFDGARLVSSMDQALFIQKAKEAQEEIDSSGLEEFEQVNQWLSLLSTAIPELPNDLSEWLALSNEAMDQLQITRVPNYFRFIELPESYKDFSSFYLRQKCCMCGKTPKSPLMLCLICGALVCRKTCQDKRPMILENITGNCQTHSMEKHCGSTVFVSTEDGSVLLVGGAQNFMEGEIYLDKYGQSMDQVLKSRSADLFSLQLSQKSLEKLKDLVVNHSLAAEILSLIGRKGKSYISL